MTDIRPISRYLAGCTCAWVARRYSPVSVHVTFTAQAEPIFAGSVCMCVSSACFDEEGRSECEQSLFTSGSLCLLRFPQHFVKNCPWRRRGCDTKSEDKVRSEVSLSSSIKRREYIYPVIRNCYLEFCVSVPSSSLLVSQVSPDSCDRPHASLLGVHDPRCVL